MKHGWLCVLVGALAGCGEVNETPSDAPVDTPIDEAVGIDARPGPSLGAFTVEPVGLNTPRMQFAMQRIMAKLYVIGGRTATAAAVDTVEVSTIAASGFGAFTTLTSKLVHPRAGATVFIASTTAGTYLWVVGGSDASGNPVPQIERAPIGGTGEIGGFSDAVTAGDESRRIGATFLSAGNPHLVGGAVAGAMRANVARTMITGDTMAAFASLGASPALSMPRHYATGFENAAAMRAFVIGGQDLAGAPSRATDIITFSNAGIGSIAAGPDLMTARAGAMTVVDNGRAWIIGGSTGSAALDTIEWIDVDGTAFAPDPATLTVGRAFGASTKIANKVCLVGGTTNGTQAGVTGSISCAPLVAP